MAAERRDFRLNWKTFSGALVIGGALLITGELTRAQEMIGADACRPLLTELWTNASNVCVGRPEGFICNGGGAPSAEPQGAVSNALLPTGALVEAAAVDALRTPPIAVEQVRVGAVWLRLPAPIGVNMLMLGDVTLRDVSPPEFPAWQSAVLQTDVAAPSCAAAPRNALILQTSQRGVSARIVINGVSVALGDTLLVRTENNATLFTALAGCSTVLAQGVEQTLLPGQQLSVPHLPDNPAAPAAPPTAAVPLDLSTLQNLPVALFDRPLILPQPGNVSTLGAVNLRVEPNTNAAVLVQVPGGEVMSVLGRNDDGSWYHVRRDSGETGWMLAELLAQNVGTIQAIYSATPLPPQRFGSLGTQGRINAIDGVNLRAGPEVSFGLVTTLPNGTLVDLVARSPYSPWVQVQVQGVVGWVPLIAMETAAFIDALPVDYTVPLPPPTPVPTLPPGSFGNAFPDPNAGE